MHIWPFSTQQIFDQAEKRGTFRLFQTNTHPSCCGTTSSFHFPELYEELNKRFILGQHYSCFMQLKLQTFRKKEITISMHLGHLPLNFHSRKQRIMTELFWNFSSTFNFAVAKTLQLKSIRFANACLSMNEVLKLRTCNSV